MPLPPTEISIPQNENPEVALKRLTEGLIFLSESEASFEVVRLKDLQQLPVGEPIRQQPLSEILGERSNPPEGAGPTDLKQASQYAALFDYLQSKLKNAAAYRIGSMAPQTLFLVGQLPDGSWIGVRTTTVET